jgi:hypothetical protein
MCNKLLQCQQSFSGCQFKELDTELFILSKLFFFFSFSSFRAARRRLGKRKLYENRQEIFRHDRFCLCGAEGKRKEVSRKRHATRELLLLFKLGGIEVLPTPLNNESELQLSTANHYLAHSKRGREG